MGWFTRNRQRRGSAGKNARRRPDANPDPVAPLENSSETPREPRVPDELADFFLVMDDHLTEVEREDVVEIADRLGQPPPILERLSKGLDDPEELAEAVKSNPALTADILRTVNSAFFSLQAPISSIQHAINYLGTSLVKDLVLQSTISNQMEFEQAAQQAAYMRLWRSSYVASTVALMLGQNQGMKNASVLSTRALLTNLGDLALLSARPETAALYAPQATLLARTKAQQAELVANAAVIGGMLARQWGLPEDLSLGLRGALIPMALPPAKHPDGNGELDAAVVCYVAGRVGDQVAFHGLRDVGALDLLAQEELDYFFLPAYLQAAKLPQLPAALQDATVRRRINQLISTFGEGE